MTGLLYLSQLCDACGEQPLGLAEGGGKVGVCRYADTWIIVAGSYLQAGRWTFWGVRGSGDKAIEVDLVGLWYHRLVIDVADPDAERDRLQATISRGTF